MLRVLWEYVNCITEQNRTVIDFERLIDIELRRIHI